MKRINGAITLLEQGLPVFATGAGEISYAGGEAASQSWADWLIVEMEHPPLDIPGLAAFMRGFAEGLRNSNREVPPGVGVTLPIDGTDAASVRANSWMIKQVLATGVHGLTMCHAESPEAVAVLVETMRYSNRAASAEQGLGQGRRGHGAQALAAAVWGVTPAEYIERADLWSLNPSGEILLCLKVENPRALENAETVLAVKGVTSAEWGPADMSLAFGTPGIYDTLPLREARRRVQAACAANNVRFLHNANVENVATLIDEGVGFITCTEPTAVVGRSYLRSKGRL